MAKLKQKHLNGTVPGNPKMLLCHLSKEELDKLAKTEGYEHLFETQRGPKPKVKEE